MKLHRNIEQLPSFRNAIVTIGTFDGVHLGHQTILSQMKTLARQVNGETVIITFHPHPRRIVGSTAQPVSLLNSLPEKIELLEKAGIDHLVVVPFTADFAQQTPVEYVEEFLVAKFQPHSIIIGYDHRFGKGRAGDYQLLESYAQKGIFGLVEIPGKILEEATVSSTRIRQALVQGDVRLASGLLGYDYFFEGIVVKGNQLGRKLGYPTANILLTDNEKLVPGNGVYAVRVCINRSASNGNVYLKGMMNIGVRPTVDGLTRVIEVHLFEFDEEIYGQNLQVTVHQRLRAEQKFDGLQALTEQLAKDKIASLEALA